MITDLQYRDVANFLKIDVSLIKAVAGVESQGSGFFADGKLKILFEPHIFWRELKIAGYDPKIYAKQYWDVLWPKWGDRPYGKYSDQWRRLNKAATINKEVAYKSASWGKFQILGNNHIEAGYVSVIQMVEAFKTGEGEHLRAFASFLKANGLHKYLQPDNAGKIDYAGFASRYNGPGYDDKPGRFEDYDYKIEQLHIKLKRLS